MREMDGCLRRRGSEENILQWGWDGGLLPRLPFASEPPRVNARRSFERAAGTALPARSSSSSSSKPSISLPDTAD